MEKPLRLPKRHSTLRNIAYFLVAVVFGKFIGAFTSLLLAKFLAPADFGLWSTMFILISLTPIVCLGTVEALIKQYPLYQGRGDFNAAKRLEQAVCGSVLIAILITCGGGLSSIGLMSAVGSIKSDLFPLTLFVFIALFAQLEGFFYFRLTARQHFHYVSIIDTARSVLTFAGIVLGAWLWGLNGATVGLLIEAAGILLLVFLLNRRLQEEITPLFDWKLIWSLVKVGFPITVVWWIFYLQTDADRLISIIMLGKESTGHYSLGARIISILILIPLSVSRVLYPRMSEEIGKDISSKNLTNLLLLPSRTMSLIMPLCIGLLYILLPKAYHDFFPRYEPGLVSAQILLISAFFACLLRPAINYLIARDMQKIVLIFALISLGTNIVLGVISVWAGFGINGIATATAISSILLSSLIWIRALIVLGMPLLNALQTTGALYMPMCYLGIFIAGSLLIPNSYLQSWLGIIIECGIFFLIYSAGIGLVPPLNVWCREIGNILQVRIANKFNKKAPPTVNS